MPPANDDNDLEVTLAMLEASDREWRAHILGRLARIDGEIAGIKTAFLPSDGQAGGRDYIGHANHHQAESDSRKGWVAFFRGMRQWAAQGVLGATGLGVLYLVIEWLRGGAK